MTVKQLIEELEKIDDKEKEVFIYNWDNATYTDVPRVRYIENFIILD